jgi:hypothetical protein
MIRRVAEAARWLRVWLFFLLPYFVWLNVRALLKHGRL